MEGWIKLNRRLREWEWYTDENVIRVWLHLLLSCNYEEKNWKGTIVKPGQYITSYSHLANSLGLSVHQVRTALDKLKTTGEVTIESTNKYTLVTIEKWGIYQQRDDADGKQNDNQAVNQMAIKWQSNGNQMATTKERKEIKKLRNKELSYSFNEFNNEPRDGIEAFREEHERFQRLLREDGLLNV